jgi:hypothetical protein
MDNQHWLSIPGAAQTYLAMTEAIAAIIFFVGAFKVLQYWAES